MATMKPGQHEQRHDTEDVAGHRVRRTLRQQVGGHLDIALDQPDADEGHQRQHHGHVHAAPDEPQHRQQRQRGNQRRRHVQPTRRKARARCRSASASSAKVSSVTRQPDQHDQPHRPHRRGEVADGADVLADAHRFDQRRPGRPQDHRHQHGADTMEDSLQQRRARRAAALEPLEQHVGAREAAAVQRVGQLQEDDADDRQRHQLGDAAHRRTEQVAPEHVAVDQQHQGHDPQRAQRIETANQPVQAERQRLAVGIGRWRRGHARACAQFADQSRGSCVPAFFSASM